MREPKNEDRKVQAASAGELPQKEPTLEEAYREHARHVLAAAHRVTGSAEDAEDVLQTVFTRLARRQGAGATTRPYLHRAAINAALDLVRSRKSNRSTPLQAVEPILADDARSVPDRLQLSGEIRDQVRAALAALSPKSAEIFVLRYFEGYDNHEIASMLGTSRSTVAVVLHRSRQRVRETIRPYTGDPS